MAKPWADSGEGGEAACRRQAKGGRVLFEALVAACEAGKGGGFEAESVDVSPEGMRLRTAYLPNVGDKLLCRLDGFGDEVVVEGVVVWKAEQSKGGEFGLRFVDLEPIAADAVRALCSAAGRTSSPPESAPPSLKPSARVRLHIDGLAAPMKARVREGTSGGVRIGTNLEFLKVGRTLELEDVERGARRPAFIDQVRVDVDPATSVPELVVSLRFESKDAPLSSASLGVAPTRLAEPEPAGVASSASSASKEDAPVLHAPPREAGEVAPTIEDDGDDEVLVAPPAGSVALAPTLPAPDAHPEVAPEARIDAKNDAKSDAKNDAKNDARPDASDEAGEASADAASSKLSVPLVAAKAKEAGIAVAKKVGPALSGASAKANEAIRGLVKNVRERRAARAEGTKVVLRRTAPAPGGALKSEGRRLVREQGEDPIALPAGGFNKKAALTGTAIGLASVLAIFGVVRALGGAGANPEPLALPAASAGAAEGERAAIAAAAGVGSVDVPLFGATPLSTTEPIPAPAPGDAAAAEAEEPSLADEPKVLLSKEFGQGEVRRPIRIRLRMDGPVEGVQGAAGSRGFTVTVPGRRSLATGEDLGDKDKRISHFNVVNGPSGAEITVQFRGEVPPYVVRPTGDRLEIALGKNGDSDDEPKRRVASKPKKSSKSSKAKKSTQKKSKSKKSDD